MLARANSAASDDKDPDGVDFRGESAFEDTLVVRSAREEEFEDAEEWCDPEVGCVVRDRTDRRGEVPAIEKQDDRILLNRV